MKTHFFDFQKIFIFYFLSIFFEVPKNDNKSCKFEKFKILLEKNLIFRVDKVRGLKKIASYFALCCMKTFFDVLAKLDFGDHLKSYDNSF